MANCWPAADAQQVLDVTTVTSVKHVDRPINSRLFLQNHLPYPSSVIATKEPYSNNFVIFSRSLLPFLFVLRSNENRIHNSWCQNKEN